MKKRQSSNIEYDNNSFLNMNNGNNNETDLITQIKRFKINCTPGEIR